MRYVMREKADLSSIDENNPIRTSSANALDACCRAWRTTLTSRIFLRWREPVERNFSQGTHQIVEWTRGVWFIVYRTLPVSLTVPDETLLHPRSLSLVVGHNPFARFESHDDILPSCTYVLYCLTRSFEGADLIHNAWSTLGLLSWSCINVIR